MLTYVNNRLVASGYDIFNCKNDYRFKAKLVYDWDKDTKNFKISSVGDNKTFELNSSISSTISFPVKFMDVNMDGYVDIAFLYGESESFHDYKLFVWDESKVKFTGLLSDFETKDNYIINKVRKDVGYTEQKLVWENSTTLVVESVTEY